MKITKKTKNRKSGYIFNIAIFLALTFLLGDLLLRRHSLGPLCRKIQSYQKLRIGILNSQTSTMNNQCSKLTIEPKINKTILTSDNNNLLDVSVFTDSSKSRFLAYYEASTKEMTQGTLESLTKKGLETITILKANSSLKKGCKNRSLKDQCTNEMVSRLEEVETNFEYLKLITQEDIEILYKTALKKQNLTNKEIKNIKKATAETMRNLKQFTF